MLEIHLFNSFLIAVVLIMKHLFHLFGRRGFGWTLVRTNTFQSGKTQRNAFFLSFNTKRTRVHR